MQKTEAATENASAMTAAATDTHCSTKTRSAGGQQQSLSQHGAVPDSSVQRILAQMLQTAEAAEQIKRQRDALALPSHTTQQQPQGLLAPASLSLERLLSCQAVGPDQLQQQLHELASLLSLPAMSAGTRIQSTSAAAAAAAGAGGPAAAVLGHACLQQGQGQQQHEDCPGSPVPTRQLQHMCSMADSSKQEAAAVDALLDLEFAARDAGSFTQNRAQIAAALARAIAGERQQQQALSTDLMPAEQQDQAAGTGATIKLESLASPTFDEAAAAGGMPRRRSSSGPCPSAPVAAAAAHHSAVCAAAASAPAPPSSDRTGAQAQHNLQQELVSLLSQLSQVGAQHGHNIASAQLGARAAVSGAEARATGQAGDSPLPAVPPFMSSGPQPAGLSEDVPILPVMQRVKQQLGLQQQANQAEVATAINPGAAAATAAAAGLGPMRSETSGFLKRLLQQSRQLQSPSGGNSAGLEQQPAADGPGALLRSTSNLTSSTVVPGFGLNSAGAAAAAAGMGATRMQQQALSQQQAPAATEGPYSSYLDADLLALYAEFKTTRKQVLAIVREAVDQGVMKSTVVRRLHQLQQSRQRVTDSPSFTLGGTTATAAPSGGAAPAPSTGTQPSGGQSLGKRSRDQHVEDAGATADTAVADADAPSSKLRRTEGDKADAAATGKPAAEATAGTGPGAETGDAAADAQAGADAMDTSAPDDNSAPADSVKADCVPADGAGDKPADAAPGAPGAPADAQAAATAAARAPAAEDAQTTPTGIAAAAAEPAVPAAVEGATTTAAAAAAPSAAGEQSLLSRSVEALVLIHSLTNRALSKAVSAKKEGAEALNRADQLETMTAVSNSNTQHLQLQNQMLQQQLQLAQLQLQAKQQQLQQIQARSQHTTVAYPQLVSRVAKSVTRLVATAYREHLPVAERQELAMIAEELLNSCQHH